MNNSNTDNELKHTKTTDQILDIIDTGDTNRYAVALRLTKWHEDLINRQITEADSNWYGVDGYWIASVQSQNYPDTTHAIVMFDEDVFHDPSPKKKFKKIGLENVLVSYHIELTDITRVPAKPKASL